MGPAHHLPTSPATQAVALEALAAAHAADHAAHEHVVHRQYPEHARFIHDLRELFEVKVVGLVLVTGWGGLLPGVDAVGVSTLQRGTARHALWICVRRARRS